MSHTSYTPTLADVRAHDVIKRRTSKGATTGRVVRFGQAQVIGDVMPTGVPVIGDGRYCAFQLELEQIQRGTFGRSAIALTKLADAMYADYGLEPLLGTEVRGFQQMTPEPMCDPLDGSVVARHRCYISGGQVPALDELATPESVYKAQTRYNVTTSTHRTRTRLVKPRLRKSEAHYAGQLVTSADRPDAMFVGHTLVKRATLAPRKRRTVRASRTIIGDAAPEALPTDIADLERTVSAIPPGTRAVFEHDGQRVTVSVSAGKRVSAQIGVGPDRVKLQSNRTALGAARRILVSLPI